MFDATGRVRPMFDAGWVESLLSCQCMNEKEARTSMIITKRQPFSQTVNHRGPVGEADAQAQYSDFLQDDLPDDFPGPVMSAPAMVFEPTRRKIPSTTGDKTARRHSVTGATGVTTGLGDAAGRNHLGRGLSALLGVDIAPAEQSDFADDNRDPNKMKVLDELKKKEERTDRIKAEVKALDYDIQKIEAKVADESKRLDLAATIYHDFTRTRDAKDEKRLKAKGELVACQQAVQGKLRELVKLREKRNEKMLNLRDLLSHRPMVFRVSSFGDNDPRAKDQRHKAQRRGSGITGLLP